MSDVDSNPVRHCTCAAHCKTSCGYFQPIILDGEEIQAFCDLYGEMLPKDYHYLRYNCVLFFRTRDCRSTHTNRSECRECQAVN